jgi:hypothetical protein
MPLRLASGGSSPTSHRTVKYNDTGGRSTSSTLIRRTSGRKLSVFNIMTAFWTAEYFDAVFLDFKGCTCRCHICGLSLIFSRQTDTGTGFASRSFGLPCQYHSTSAPCLSWSSELLWRTNGVKPVNLTTRRYVLLEVRKHDDTKSTSF